MQKYKIFLRPVIVFLMINIIMLHMYAPFTDMPKVKGGTIELTYSDLRQYKAVPLSGEWELLPGQGYATYLLHVKTSFPADTMLGLKTNAMSSAYKIFINEKLIASNGVVSNDPAGEIGEFRPQLVFFNSPPAEFDIIVQISNYHHSKGGFWNNILLGSADNMAQYYNKKLNLEFLTIGSLLTLTVFSLARYIRDRSRYSYLFFGMNNIVVIFLIDFMNEMLVFSLLKIDFEGSLFIWFTLSFLTILLFVAYYWSVMRTKPFLILLKIYLVIFIVYELVCCITKPVLYTQMAMVRNTLDAVFIAAVMILVFYEAVKGCFNGELHVMSVLTLMEVYVNGIVNYNNYYIHYSSVGFILFGLIQVIIQVDFFAKVEDEKTAAELLYLRAQINPHFLYNTLNTFISLSRSNLESAIDLLYSLIDYLRESFDIKNCDQFIPLSREINHAQKYLEIEKARFDDRLDICLDANADPDIAVPAMILQPVIENAIKHGIFPKKGVGLLQISIRQEESKLVFRIADDGVGISEKRLEEVLNGGLGSGVGISNINRRLKLLCKTKLNIWSEVNIGTEVTWKIPIRKKH